MTIPVDFGFEEIEWQDVSNASTYKTGVILPEIEDVKAALPYLEQAQNLSCSSVKVFVMAMIRSRNLPNISKCPWLPLF